MSDKLKFYLITDLHYLSGDSQEEKDGRKIIEGAFNQIADDKSTEYVFIPGDLTQNGDEESLESVHKLLEKLRDSGKKIYVTFATHDWWFHGAREDRRRVREMFDDFGWAQSVDEYPESNSYAVRLCDGWTLLALNDDGDGREFCGYSDDELQWIKKHIDEAKKCGDEVVAMTHHPVAPPNVVYPMISHKDMLGGYETTGPFLCESGLKYLFVGHTHMQSVEKLEKNGNILWQVNTASITQYPANMRIVEETDEGLDVRTVYVDKKYCDFDGKSVYEKMKGDFDGLLEEAFYSVGYDVPRFAQIAGSLSIDKNTVMKYRKFIAPAGKFLYKLTVKKAARLLRCSSKDFKSIADVKVRNILIRVVRNIYRGGEDISPDTPEYKFIIALAGRASKLLKKKMNMADPAGLIEKIIYDAGPDDQNCVLK